MKRRKAVTVVIPVADRQAGLSNNHYT